MFDTTIEFKLGKLSTLEKQNVEITEENNGLNFHIEGKDNNKNEYSLTFISLISLSEMLNFKLYEKIDFLPYLDEGDIVFGKNGIYDLNTEIKIEIMRYLPNSFILLISFIDRDNIVGNLELSFSKKS